MSNAEEKYVIYTDGGCTGNPGPGGWAAVIMAEGRNLEMSGGDSSTTNNRMEMTAAVKALLYGKQQKWSDETIHLYTDSEYLKNGITSWINKWKINGWKTAAKKPVKNKDLWVELDEALAGLDVRWHWVKGHAGNTFNERCDELVAAERMKFK